MIYLSIDSSIGVLSVELLISDSRFGSGSGSAEGDNLGAQERRLTKSKRHTKVFITTIYLFNTTSIPTTYSCFRALATDLYN